MAERPTFDPRKIRGQPAGEPDGPSTLTVRQVNDLVRGAIAQHVPSTLHVLGEISNLSRPNSGHLYFTLKDPHSELRCVMWRSAALKLKFAPAGGMEVIATGGLEVYTPRGAYQLIVRKLEPRGMGALELAFRQMCARLEREGLFDPSRKRPLPKFPERIAVVTSPSGAAIRDILQTLNRRFPALAIFVFPVRVQGEGAAVEIAQAIQGLNRCSAVLGGIDAAIVGRGGGSLEDLWAFNEEVVARAIAASRIPIISAVGHEVDVSISDLVADVRAATPTAAAELVAPTMVALLDHLTGAVARAVRAVRHRLELSRADLGLWLACEWLARPQDRLQVAVQRVDEVQQRLRLAMRERSRAARETVNGIELRLLRFGTGARFSELRRALDRKLHRLTQRVASRLRGVERALWERLGRAHRRGPVPAVRLARQRLAASGARALAALRALLRHRQDVLAGRTQAVVASGPAQTLKRGYAIARHARTRRVIRSITEIRDRMPITTELADGEFRATADDPRQPGLFDETARGG